MVNVNPLHLLACTLHFFFNKFIYFIYLFLAALGSSLLCTGFLQLRQAGATLRCGARASHCSGFSCCGARALGTQASGVVAHGLQSTGSVVVARVLSSCGSQAQQLWHAGPRVQAQQLWSTGLVALQHVGSSRTRAQTRAPALAGGFLTTAPPRKPLYSSFLKKKRALLSLSTTFCLLSLEIDFFKFNVVQLQLFV